MAALANRRARLEQAVQLASLAEHRRLGRVEVLRLAAVEDTTAETDDRALHRPNGEHDPVPEAVVALPARRFADVARPRFVGLGDHQAAFLEERIVVARKDARQAAPAVACVPEAKAGRNLPAEAATLEVGDGALAALQLAPVPAAARARPRQRGALLLAGRLCGRRRPPLRDRRPPAGRVAHGLDKPCLLLHAEATALPWTPQPKQW